MTPAERARRLIADSDRRIAVFSPPRMLLAPTERPQAVPAGAASLAGLGWQALAAQALANGHAPGRRDGGEVSTEIVIDRIDSDSETTLVVHFSAPRVTQEPPAQPLIVAAPPAAPA